MALMKEISLLNNFGEQSVFPEAYIKVAGIAGDKKLMTADVQVFSSQGGCLIDRKEVSFPPDLDGENFFIQAYGAVANTDSYRGSTPC